MYKNRSTPELLTLESNKIKTKAINSGDLNCYARANGIIDSEKSATFITLQNKIGNGMPHESKQQIANGKVCFTTHLGKAILPIGNNALYLPS